MLLKANSCCLLLLAGLTTFALVPPLRAEEPPIRVTVVAILASNKKDKIDKQLTELAAELRKKDPALKGFTLKRTNCLAMEIGAKESFQLIDELEAVVRLRDKDKKTNRVSLTVTAPTLSAISYTTCCGKFFPLTTDHVTKDGERLIVAVMVRPCDDKK